MSNLFGPIVDAFRTTTNPMTRFKFSPTSLVNWIPEPALYFASFVSIRMALSVTIQRSPLVAERANQHPPTSTLQTLSCGFSSCLQGFPSIQEFYLPCAIFLSIFLQNFICPEFYLALHDFSAHFFPLSIWVPYFIWSFFPIADLDSRARPFISLSQTSGPRVIEYFGPLCPFVLICTQYLYRSGHTGQ
jgi:hypothetical protein